MPVAEMRQRVSHVEFIYWTRYFSFVGARERVQAKVAAGTGKG